MNERFLNDFAGYYKRIIRVERNLKDLIIEKYSTAYNQKAYQILYKAYLKNLRQTQNSNDKTFQKIYNDTKKSQNEKFQISVDKMYTSEVLSLFSHKVYLKNSVRKNFFDKTIKTSSNNFRQIAKNFKNFRNCICHFDTKQFLKDKSRFLNALTYFEKIVNCKYRFSLGSLETISHNISITSILKYIYNTHPEYFNDDRILVNVFDDIALLLDYKSDKLPQYKSIIRQKYRIEGKK